MKPHVMVPIKIEEFGERGREKSVSVKSSSEENSRVLMRVAVKLNAPPVATNEKIGKDKHTRPSADFCPFRFGAHRGQRKKGDALMVKVKILPAVYTIYSCDVPP